MLKTLLILNLFFDFIYAKQCNSNEFIYKYTECDNNGERWRIALPKNNLLNCDNLPQPQNGVNCSFTCEAGYYLDIENQKCKKCLAGTYSLGSGQRYEMLTKWPLGFFVENYPDPAEQFFSATVSTPQNCPQGVGWIIEEGEIRYKPTTCISRLTISFKLQQSGYIEFTYKVPRNSRGLLSSIDIKNEQCQSYKNQLGAFAHPFDEESMENPEWLIKKFDLKKGKNLVTWTVANNVELTTLADVIYVSKIDIIGLSYTSTCSLCPEGTYSESEGQAICKSCPANYYSNRGAKKCEVCSQGRYSSPRSKICKQKPFCEASDYYPAFGSCFNSKQQITFKSISPMICQEARLDSTMKPKDEEKSCLKCSPGMQRDANGKCIFCKTGYYSLGDSCLKCPSKTRPNNGYFITNWEHLPEFIETDCEYVTYESSENNKCKVNPSWISMGDRIESATTRETGVVMEMSVNIKNGFYNYLFDDKTESNEDYPLATFSIDFETQCFDESCSLYIVQEMNIKRRKTFNFLNVFNGTVLRKKIEYPIYYNGESQIIIAFMRSGTTIKSDFPRDKTIIYSLNITNVGDSKTKTMLGGADKCIPCFKTDSVGNCETCPAGQYVDANRNLCVQCPDGTILNKTSTRIGPESCVKCSTNMESENGVKCIFTGKISILNKHLNERHMRFDLSSLKNKTLVADGIKVFAREGDSYYHSYNISIFDKIQCGTSNQKTNFDSIYDKKNDYDVQFCRLTAVPVDELNSKVGNKIIYVSPLIIGKKITSITMDRKYEGFYLTDKLLEYDTMTDKNRPIDLHFYFEKMQSQFRKCPNGTIGVITTRCDPVVTNEPLIRLSRGCPDGTCDGCIFHVFVETSHACPICDSEDFKKIKGECINGKQQVHWIPSKHCVLSGAQAKEQIDTCTESSGLKMLLLLAITLILLLFLINIIFYQKNRRLEYKYMRIVEGKEPEEMETCGIISDDDEDDLSEDDENSGTRVYFGKKRAHFIAGIKKVSKNAVSAVKDTSGNINKPRQDEEQNLMLSDET